MIDIEPRYYTTNEQELKNRLGTVWPLSVRSLMILLM